MKTTRFTTMSAAILVTVFSLGSLSACGGSSSASGSDPASGSQQEITIATGNDGKPFCSMNEDGEFDGYDIAIMKAVEQKLSKYYKFTFEGSDFPTTLSNLSSGKAQIATYEYENNAERKAKFTYGTVGLTKWDTLIISDPSNGKVYQSFDELKGKKIYVTTATNQAAMAESYLKEHPDAFKLVYGTYSNEQIVQGLTSGSYDATLAPQYSLDLWNNAFHKGLKGSDKAVNKSSSYILFNKSDDKNLIDRVNKAMADLKKDGTFKKLSEQYYGADYVPED
ncbi:transporter substrate-binding domain-containing protein [Bifidobacterium merycicum]|uniref:Amino acid ABC superfamily ATP binding cassette transporter, binding protein n=1 Tax=Bifidobacterium merycicum TaxID=78345 RepID=A0A087BDD5_9BIFI|nr:transporter substrate-binding domain-containing protein [Bifidobacterium merycicum]KFI69035.1 amino acid ABC superfamily ATP binding cassette transporter, binding protein [Bifidobacterium merycicum]SHE64531.1 amino acid ABC transporter substrate-binding protein, PAAT family (TC 3.A.1.3.-) [Bifidobacterium merycicum DSM 6492]